MKRINVEIEKYCHEISIVDFKDYFAIKIIIDVTKK